MALDTALTATASTRRALLAGSLGALVAYLAQAVGRPLPARAEGEIIHVGDEFTTATTVTEIQNTTNGNTVFRASSSGAGVGVVGSSGSSIGVSGASGSGAGVRGSSNSSFGVHGSSSSNVGVYGFSSSNIGVYGFSNPSTAVWGDNEATDKPAVRGQAFGGNTGVQGYSGGGSPPATPAKTGVYGYANQDANARGVTGESVDGTGVRGDSSSSTGVRGGSESGFGVVGSSDTNAGVFGTSSSSHGVVGQSESAGMAGIKGSSGSNTGVFGFSVTGPAPPTPAKTGVYGHAVEDATSRGVWGRANAGRGVYGQASSGRGVDGVATGGRGVSGSATTGTGGYFAATTGTALQAVGPVRFSSAGLATIPSGSKSVTVSPGIDITGASKVLALPQTNPGGSTTIQRISRNTVADTFTIFLTANATANTTVAWFLIS